MKEGTSVGEVNVSGNKGLRITVYFGLSQRTSSSFTPTVPSCCLVTLHDVQESSCFKRSEASIIDNSTNPYKYCESHKNQTCNKNDV
jgi:hypothetical protein